MVFAPGFFAAGNRAALLTVAASALVRSSASRASLSPRLGLKTRNGQEATKGRLTQQCRAGYFILRASKVETDCGLIITEMYGLKATFAQIMGSTVDICLYPMGLKWLNHVIRYIDV